MLKPLLRVIPEMSGNVKLACNIIDYKRIKHWDKTEAFETDIRYACLMPLSSSLYTKKIDAGLLTSSWEFDIKKFYHMYADSFYNDCYIYDKENILKIDRTVDQMLRATDFQYGAKRIPYMQQGSQFSFFAPFYADCLEDMPAYFMIYVKMKNSAYEITKQIKVNIMSNGDSPYNYLYHYMKKYGERLDDNVAFCIPEEKQVAYFGIDAVNGGFVKYKDNVANRIFEMHNTIHNFDATITQGFMRNKMVMKQIVPLCFNFNINDILTQQEKFRYNFNNVTFSGEYFDHNNNPLGFYDFSIDYDMFKQEVLRMSEEDGRLIYSDGACENIMDVNYPSLNEARYVNYRFANKLSANFCRWKMKYSDDEHPYIMNMSWAFSHNQMSNYKYGEFPVNFYQIESLANYVKEGHLMNYNLLLPLSSSKETYDKYNEDLSREYANIINQYSVNWFEVIENYNDSIFDNQSLWKDVNEDHVYYRGILYNLNNIYSNKPNPEKIDKFAVLIEPEHEFLTSTELDNLKFTNITLYRQNGSNVTDANCVANDSILHMHYDETSYSNFLYANEDLSNKVLDTDEIRLNRIFTYAYANGNYVDLKDLGIDYYNINQYYDADTAIDSVAYANTLLNGEENKLASYFIKSYYDIFENISSYNIPGYLYIPIYRTAMITYDTTYDSMSYNYDMNSSVINLFGFDVPEFLKENLYIHSIDNQFDEFFNTYVEHEIGNTTYSYLSVNNILNDATLANSLYIKHNFIKSSYIKQIAEDFDPVLLQAYISELRAYDFTVNELDYSYWNYEDINNASYWDEQGNVTVDTAYACYLYKDVNDWKHYVGEAALGYLVDNAKTEYQFNPILDNNGEVFVNDVFTEPLKYTGKFYGDYIPANRVNEDKDVIWADMYNLSRIFFKNRLPAKFDEFTTSYFYNRFLDKKHIYYYYSELFLDENYNYKTAQWILSQDRTPGEEEEFYEERFILDETTDESPTFIATDFYPRYDEWFDYDWHTTIFIKKKVWIFDENSEEYSEKPKVKVLMKNIGNIESFEEWYDSIEYDENTDLFYYKDKPEEKFELMFHKKMYRVDSKLWDIADIEDIENTKYKDIYFYRIQSPKEYDVKYTNVLKYEFIGDVEQLNEYSDIIDPDGCLIPMFDDIFAQPEDEALIMVHYLLRNISKTWNEYEQTYNFRYDKNDKVILMEVSDEEKALYNITKTYTEYDTASSTLNLKSNDLEYGEWHLNTRKINGVNYGFYLINSHINNTSNTFKTTAIVENDYLYNIKYLFYINGVNIIKDPSYVSKIYKQLSPLMSLKPISMLTNITTIVYPRSFRIPLIYKQNKYNNSDATEINITVDPNNANNGKIMTLNRYMHAMTPLINRQERVNNTYRLKLKDVDKTLIDTGILNSIGDSIIYKTDDHINKFMPTNVYSTSPDIQLYPDYNYKAYEVEPVEYNHYNCSKFINLKEHFKIAANKRFKYIDLVQAQSNEAVIDVFRTYISKMSGRKFYDYEVLFLLNKYNVSFDSVSVGLTLNKEEKLYSLTYCFDLK